MLRRVLMTIALIAIVVAGIDSKLLSIPFYDRAALAAVFEQRYGAWGGFSPFLDGVRAHTRAGESVAVLVPTVHWEGGYSYAYYRASYVLAGREVLPLFDDADRFHPENLRRAELVAIWGAPVPPTHRKFVWQGYGGLLVRR